MASRHALTSAVALTVTLVAGAAAPALAAGSAVQPAGTLVGATPAKQTPHVLDGRVNAVAQVGSTVVIGGSFTAARDADGTADLARANLLAFDAATGRISTTFVPQPDGEVTSLVAAGDGTVLVGGRFSKLGGVSRGKVAKVRVSDGAVVTAFNAGTVNGAVTDLRLAGTRLWLAGAFTTVRGSARTGLATVDATTGALDGYMGLSVTGTHQGGRTAVAKIDVTPDGSRLVAVGNFSAVGGSTRNQVAMLDLTGASATLAPWRTTWYAATCSSSFDTYVRDVDVAPDGSYLVIGTTGGYKGSTSPCDSVARFEVGTSSSALSPSWVDHTGGDTTYTVEATPSAVYVGGHQRWWNNPSSSDKAGPGAVARAGIAALDPVNGLPYSWNPGRTRGVGVFDLLLTGQGLYVASDTDRIATMKRGRIALMPLAGTTVPAVRAPDLPGDVLVAGDSGTLTRRSMTASGSVTASQPASTGDIAWSTVRGAFQIGEQVYLAHSDGTLTRRTFDGTAWGTPVSVNGQDLVVTLSDWRSDVQNATGMFYDEGRIYFTRSGSSQLFYRYFTPESGVVGATRYVASNGISGLSLSSVRGLFLAGDSLYGAGSNGALYRIGWERTTPDRGQSGVPTGSATQVSGPGMDALTWNGRALLLHSTPVNAAPSAAFASSCTGLTCTFDASASADPENDALTYRWDLGDGSTATGRTVTRTYSGDGERAVTLTVSDGTSTATAVRTVSAVAPVVRVGFVDAAATQGNRSTHTVKVPSSVRAGDTLLLFLTTNSAATLTDPAGWTRLQAVDGTDVRGRAYTRTGTAADAGTTVTVTSSAAAKSTVTLGVYRDAEVSASAGTVVTKSGSAVTAPPVPVATAGSWYVGAWSEKSPAVPTWTLPGELTTRSTVAGSGTGKVSAVLADSGAPVAAGTAGGLTATTSAAVNRGVAFSVVLAPAG